MRPIVAIPFKTQAQNITPEVRRMLIDAGFDLVCNETGKALSKEDFKAMVKDAFAVIAGTEEYDEEILDAAKNLKTVIRFGVGTDNFDLKKMAEKGIKVGVIANYNAVAEFALGLMLSCYRHIPQHDGIARQACWTRLPMREISGKTVGIVGFGRIGKRLAKLLSGFDANVLAYDPYMDRDAAAELNVRCATFDEILAESDILSLHLPSTPETRHIICKDTISRMKDGAVLINTARGSLVDENALYDALSRGKLLAAGLDVFENEPVQADDKILQLTDCTVVAPHAAASTEETAYNGGLICARSIIQVYNNGNPVYPVCI
jgi:D-3-phosphoglycerate dehydrogenase